jgi:UDP-N-acetylmuramate dehydrogenase
MNILENISLESFNTFGIDVTSRYFSEFNSVEELAELFEAKQLLEAKHRIILGGGSNILFSRDIDGIVLHNVIPGIEKVEESDDFVMLRVGAGVNWHAFVLHCVENGWAGVENLSLIPGCVGASPMQNIGAYGVEVKEVIENVEAWDIESKKMVSFSNADCMFGYRESVFKRALKDQFVILYVTFRLSKTPKFRIEYGAIQQELEKMGIVSLSIKAVSEAVMRIRRSKLPDPTVIGNAGSFFKNPSVSSSQFENLKNEFPEIVAYPNADGSFKLAAGWLIEQCGWKGYRKGDAGCHEKQALVLVNYGTATGKEIYALSELIVNSVKSHFQVSLEREVNIYP